MVNLRDYQHAGVIFRRNLYRNAPKYKYLFHVYFDINQLAFSRNTVQGNNYGLFVHDIKLPSYNVNTQQMNQYNRKRIIQTKIKYDPVTISFHDDNFSQVTQMWEAYYKYYYKDGGIPKVVIGGVPGNNTQNTTGAGGTTTTNTLSDYNNRTTYNDSNTGNTDWGYFGETASGTGTGAGTGGKVPFFKCITVFGFYQNNFVAYSLINPLITNFAHDTYNYDEGNGTMRNTMTIDYETVVYNYGQVQGRTVSDIITGFGLPDTYDNTTSPNLTSNNRITPIRQGLRTGGLIPGFNMPSSVNNNVINARNAQNVYYQNNQNTNLNQPFPTLVGTEAQSIGLSQNPLRPNAAIFPGPWGMTPGPKGLAGSPSVDTNNNSVIVNEFYAGFEAGNG